MKCILRTNPIIKRVRFDTPEGREIEQGVIGIFGGSIFKPNEKARLRGEDEHPAAQGI